MHNTNVWELPFGETAELELHSEFGKLSVVPVAPGQRPYLELNPDAADLAGVHVERVGEAVRVALDPRRSFNWLGGAWDMRAVVHVPPDVRAHIQTSAGSVSVHDLSGCELGIKANAGKIELDNVYGLIHLSADAGSVNCRRVGGFFDVETHAGSVRMEILDLQPGEHRIRASMGSVRLALARGMDVCIETRTSLGSVRNRYPSRQTSAARLVLSTEMGSVRIEEADGFGAWPARPAPPASAATPTATATATATTPGTSPPTPRDDPELHRVLQMVEAGQISAQDADELLRAMGSL